MCLFLSILNAPLYMMYSTAADGTVNLFNINSIFQHFSLGYIGTTKQICQTSHIPILAVKGLYPGKGPIEVDKAN